MENEFNGTLEENNEKMVVVRIFSNIYWSTPTFTDENGESALLEMFPPEKDLEGTYNKEMDDLINSFNEEPVEKIMWCGRAYELWAIPYDEVDDVTNHSYRNYRWWLEDFIEQGGFSKDSIRSRYDYKGYAVPDMDYGCGLVICMVALKITERKYGEIKEWLHKYWSVRVTDYENN